MRTLKDVACSPFPSHATQPQVLKSGLVIAAPRTNLVPLKVLASQEDIKIGPGATVYVPLELGNTAWGKKVMKVDGIGEFILVPPEHIYLISYEQPVGN